MEVLLCLGFALYLAPFVAAARMDHPRLGGILALNLCLGWTGIGWLAAFVWALRPAGPPPEPEVLLRRGHLRLLAPAPPPEEGAEASPPWPGRQRGH